VKPSGGRQSGAVQGGLERALASLQAGDAAGAFAVLEGVLRLDPHNFDGLNLAGVAATRLKRHGEAITLLERAVLERSDHAGAHNNLGLALRSAGRQEEAAEAYRRTVELAPGFAPGHANLGAALAALNQNELAVESFDASLALRPDHPETLSQRGTALRRLHRFGEAIISLERAVAVAPGNVEALVARGDCYRDLKRLDEALADHRRALELDPGSVRLLSSVLRRQIQLCDWNDFDVHVAELTRRAREGASGIHPFGSLQIFDDPHLQLAIAKTSNAKIAVSPALPSFQKRTGKVHVGYFSADFRRHATMYVMAEVLALHDRERFHVSAFGFNVGKGDYLTERTRALVDEYVDLDGLSDAEAAALARERAVDIALDVKGYTKNGRPGIFANHAAPVQVNYLAYPGTMGADHTHYIVVDRVLVPDSDTAGYSEKMLWMPDSYFPRDTKALPATSRTERPAHGLPADSMVFCSFNQSSKILPDTFSDWMSVLARVDGGVLWLLADNPGAIINLRNEAAARGIDPSRLIFSDPVPFPQHLERLQLADLCLDTLPYNAHTTANDSLYVGVPIVTLPGRTFAGRVCASMLTAVGLPDLIARDRADFVRIATSLGSDREKLDAIRTRLAKAKLAAPLYDMPRYVRALEKGYELMVERYDLGMAPDHIAIELD
jgi:predicted O-linked N-acetylglucosamine transferase (SPINDLY family)